MAELNLAQMRQHYRGAVVDSEEQAQRLLSLGVGAVAAVMLLAAPTFVPALQAIWVGVCLGLAVGGILFQRKLYQRLREILLEQQLTLHTPIDMELWQKIGQMKPLPQPLDQYVEHVLETYRDLRRQVNDETSVELGQVQLLEARERLFEFLELARRTGEIRQVLDTHAQRLSDDDQMRLRQKFSEQCTGLQQIAMSFDRMVGNLAVAQVLGDDLGESTVEQVAERMRSIEEELDEVKESLAVSSR